MDNIKDIFGCECDTTKTWTKEEKPDECPKCRKPLKQPEFIYMKKAVYKGSRTWENYQEYLEWSRKPGNSKKSFGEFLHRRAQHAFKKFNSSMKGLSPKEQASAMNTLKKALKKKP